MIWNDFTITVATIALCVIIGTVCDAVVEYRRNKNK